MCRLKCHLAALPIEIERIVVLTCIHRSPIFVVVTTETTVTTNATITTKNPQLPRVLHITATSTTNFKLPESQKSSTTTIVTTILTPPLHVRSCQSQASEDDGDVNGLEHNINKTTTVTTIISEVTSYKQLSLS